jgi:hypothetical protein
MVFEHLIGNKSESQSGGCNLARGIAPGKDRAKPASTNGAAVSNHK